VEVPEGELTADFLESLLLRADSGIYVPLADIVTVESRSGFSTVRRENGLRVVTVSGDLAEDDPARATEIQRILADEILPRVTQDFGVAVQQGGLAQQERDFLGDAQVGLIVGLIGIYLTLAWIFASWTRPMVVMSVIPFGMIGAIYGHYIWGLPMSLFSIVGMIGMTGIIVNDSIVLVSTIDEYAEKRGLMPAIVDAIADRLRPVMLTTLTTVLGLAPLLYEDSSEAEFLKPTVVTLVYGLGFGMVLVLLLVPAVVAVQGDLARQITALRRMLRRGGRLRFVLWAAAGLVGVLFAATLGLAFGGDTPGWMAALWPGLAAMPAMMAALALFSVRAAAVTVLAYVAGLLLARGTRASGR
jgi:multidrug efflux pump subunit AcrB